MVLARGVKMERNGVTVVPTYPARRSLEYYGQLL